MKRFNFIDLFYEGECQRVGITTEQMDIIMKNATEEEIDQLLGEDFQPIIDKYITKS